VIVVPAGVAHRFESTGDVPLRQLSLHLAPEMVTEWLEGER
jgi:mannose-6-phosphate isomerase-like protein (cupin superfamily)